MGNRVGYIYALTEVATSGSKLFTPFKKITGYIIETTSPQTNFINVLYNIEKGQITGGQNNRGAYLQFACAATSNGEILVWGLL